MSNTITNALQVAMEMIKLISDAKDGAGTTPAPFLFKQRIVQRSKRSQILKAQTAPSALGLLRDTLA
jgi:hypothetical protein